MQSKNLIVSLSFSKSSDWQYIAPQESQINITEPQEINSTAVAGFQYEKELKTDGKYHGMKIKKIGSKGLLEVKFDYPVELPNLKLVNSTMLDIYIIQHNYNQAD